MYLLPEGRFQRLCYYGLNFLRPATILRVRNRGHFHPHRGRSRLSYFCHAMLDERYFGPPQ